MKKCLLLLVLGLAVPLLAWAQSPSFVTTWGSYGSGDGQFNYPCGVAAGPGGLVYVADQYNNRVQVFGSDGTYLSQWGAYGTAESQFR